MLQIFIAMKPFSHLVSFSYHPQSTSGNCNSKLSLERDSVFLMDNGKQTLLSPFFLPTGLLALTLFSPSPPLSPLSREAQIALLGDIEGLVVKIFHLALSYSKFGFQYDEN